MVHPLLTDSHVGGCDFPVHSHTQSVYYHIANNAMVHSVLLLSIIVLVQNAHHHICLRWQRSADVGITNVVAAAHAKMKQWKDMMKNIIAVKVAHGIWGNCSALC